MQSPADGGLSHIIEEPPSLPIAAPVFAKEALQPPPRGRASSLTAKLAEERAASGLLQLHQFSPATGQWETRSIDPPQLPAGAHNQSLPQGGTLQSSLPSSTHAPADIQTPSLAYTWQMTQMMASASVGEVTRALVRMCWRMGGGMRLPGQSDLSGSAHATPGACRDAPPLPVAFNPPTSTTTQVDGAPTRFVGAVPPLHTPGSGLAVSAESGPRPRSATDSGTIGAALASFVLRVFDDDEVELDLPPPAREAPLAGLGENEFAICTVTGDDMVLHLKLQLTTSKAGAPVLRLFFRRPPPPGVAVLDPSPVPGSASAGGSPLHMGGASSHLAPPLQAGHAAAGEGGFTSGHAVAVGGGAVPLLDTTKGPIKPNEDDTIQAPPIPTAAAAMAQGGAGGPLRRWSGSTEVFTPVARRQGADRAAGGPTVVGGGTAGHKSTINLSLTAPKGGAPLPGGDEGRGADGRTIQMHRRDAHSSGSSSFVNTSNSSFGFVMSDDEEGAGGLDEDSSPTSPGGDSSSEQLRVQTTGRWGGPHHGGFDVHVAFGLSGGGTFCGALGSVAAGSAAEPGDMMQQIAAYRSQRYTAAQKQLSTAGEGALVGTLVAGLGGTRGVSAPIDDDGSGLTDEEALAAALAEVDGCD